MSARSFAAFALVAAVGCTLPSQNPPEDLLPLCVPGFHPGQTLKVRLGPVFDASSDYVFDPSLRLVSGGPSCSAIDGLAAGVVVTLVPQKELSFLDVGSPMCAPLGQFSRASLENSDVITPLLPITQGVTIAGAFGETTFDRTSAYRAVGLFTPAMNPNGTLTPREPPPLAVSRVIETTAFQGGCGDTWVATWAP